MSEDYFNKKKRRKKSKCPNCNFTLDSFVNFCPVCGQENHGKRATIGILFHDFMQDYFTFDNKFFRSFVPLILKPGFLTKEFIEGRRKRYIPPVRLYLFISFICLLVTSFLPSGNSNNKIDIEGEIVYSDTTRHKNKLASFTEIKIVKVQKEYDSIYKVIDDIMINCYHQIYLFFFTS